MHIQSLTSLFSAPPNVESKHNLTCYHTEVWLYYFFNQFFFFFGGSTFDNDDLIFNDDAEKYVNKEKLDTVGDLVDRRCKINWSMDIYRCHLLSLRYGRLLRSRLVDRVG